MAETELEVIAKRVGKGIEWLVAHDPTGSFHLWFESGIRPGTPMPAQSEERQAEYREYHKQRVLWEKLFKRMEQLEKRGPR